MYFSHYALLLVHTSYYTYTCRVLASGANRLLVAASDGDSDSILKLVKEEGISPSHEFSHGITPLHEACEGGHIKAAELLIDLGADVNKQVLIVRTIVDPLQACPEYMLAEYPIN